MKIAYCDDLHLEVGKRDFELPDADILILAGDICLGFDLRDSFEFAHTSRNQREFFIDVSKKYKQVLYIPGNHDYWDNTLTRAISDVQEFLDSENLDNIKFSDSFSIEINDVKFVCATLWTDINKGQPSAHNMYGSSYNSAYMRDYERIKVDSFAETSKSFMQTDSMLLHSMHRDFIAEEVKNHTKVIVVTHHAPLMTCVDTDNHSNLDYFYGCTDMEDIILDNEQIKYWIYGHTHDPMEQEVGSTKLITNPRGYCGYDSLAKNFRIKVIEV